MKLIVDEDAERDLDAIAAIDEESVGLIDALLLDFEESTHLLDHLSDPDFYWGHDPQFQVERFAEMWHDGYTVYILKIYRPGSTKKIPYRVIYAHHPQRDIYYVLAAMKREQDYGSDHQLMDRIRQAYENYDCPRY